MTPSFLYVEDDEMSREIMRVLLDLHGYRKLTIFENSADFRARLETLEPVPDVIFLDIHIKPHDGFEMLHMLRETPAFADKRIIALTASVMNEEVQRLQTSGFDGAIGKPLDYDMFPEQLETIVAGEVVWYVM